jgi:hypothetical protein
MASSTKCTLELSDLHASDLVDVGSKRDPQDPMVKITVGKITQKTARLAEMCSDVSKISVVDDCFVMCAMDAENKMLVQMQNFLRN